MIEKKKKETTLPIVKSAHVLIRADARKGVASLRQPLAPTPESPTATSPGRHRKPKRKEKPVLVQRYYFIEEKRAADEMSRRVSS